MFSIDVLEWKLQNLLEEYRDKARPTIDVKEPAA
jgi:hypothetical protein